VLISFHTASEATILPKGTVQFQCNLVHLHNFVANAASEAAMKKESVQFQCDLAHEVNFLYRGLRSSHSEKRELCSFSATLCTWTIVISLPLCSLSPVQFHCHTAQLHNFNASAGNCKFAATLRKCAISLPIAATVQFHCRPVLLGNFIAKAGDHLVQFDNGAISMPPRAISQFHCQCGQLSNFAATPCSCAISLPITATV
jgi:hypothetical protein